MHFACFKGKNLAEVPLELLGNIRWYLRFWYNIPEQSCPFANKINESEIGTEKLLIFETIKPLKGDFKNILN